MKRFTTDILTTRRGKIVFDMLRLRNSLFFGAGWAAYVLLATVDMTFRGVAPSSLWSATVGLPLTLGNMLPLEVLFAGARQVHYEIALYSLVPLILFIVATALAHLVSSLRALFREQKTRRGIMLVAAKELAA